MRAIVRILHKFSIENGQAVDKQTIQNAYRKHPMKNSLRCISDVLDEIGISHQVYPLESCSDQELKGKILYIPIEHNPIWLVSFQNSNNLTLSDGVVSYTIEVLFPQGLVSTYGKKFPMIQEMDGTAEIIIKDMRLAEQLLYPIISLFLNY